MNSDLTILAELAAAFLGLFASAELLYHRAGVRAEITRKIVHVGTGLLTLLFPPLLQHFWQVALLCGSFLALLFLSKRMGWLPSIHAVQRTTSGSFLYPIIVSILFLLFQQAQQQARHLAPLLVFYIPILVMALCDPLAAAVGQKVGAANPAYRGRKTVQGSAAFFGGALVVATVLQLLATHPGSPGRVLLLSLTVAAFTTVAERWSSKGWDNFTIPLAAAAVLWGFEFWGR